MSHGFVDHLVLSIVKTKVVPQRAAHRPLFRLAVIISKTFAAAVAFRAIVAGIFTWPSCGGGWGMTSGIARGGMRPFTAMLGRVDVTKMRVRMNVWSLQPLRLLRKALLRCWLGRLCVLKAPGPTSRRLNARLATPS